MSSDNIKQKYIEELGCVFGKMLHDVEEEWSYVLHRYQEFMELFGKDERRVALLNALSPGFTHILQVELSDALILGLCRLTDRDTRSVSVCHLPRFICDNSDLKDDVERHVSRARKHARAATLRRNKWIAHRDQERPDTTVTYGDIKDGLDAVHAALNAVTMGYWKQALVNRVDSRQMPAATFMVCLEQLVEGVMYIESRIDPEGESGPLDNKVSEAFLRKIGGGPSEDRVPIERLRLAAKTIKDGMRT